MAFSSTQISICDSADVGFHGDSAFPQTYLAQLRTPFTWRKLSAALEEAERSEAESQAQP